MADKTLADVVLELKKVQSETKNTSESVDKLANVTDRFVKMLDKKFDEDKLKDAEDQKEKKDKHNGILGNFKSGLQAGAGINIMELLNPARIIAAMFGATLAGGVAFLGMRGWEKNILSLFRVRFFTSLGFTEDGKLPTLRHIGVSLITRIITAMSRLENMVLGFFGLNVQGELIRDSLGRFTGGRTQRFTVVQRVTRAINRLLSPLIAITEGVTGWIAKGGARIVGFFGGTLGLGKLGGMIGRVMRVFNKIFLPLGILIAAYDGVVAWLESDETNGWLRFGDGIGGFLGDFIGAPLNLLKDIISLGLDFIGFKSAAEWLDQFNFETIISDLVGAAFRLPIRIFDFMKAKFDEWHIAEMFEGISLRVGNALDTFRIGFVKIGTFIQNIPDRLLRIITSMLDFELPRIAIPYRLPFQDWSELVLFEGGPVFEGISRTNRAADQGITQRNSEADARVSQLEAQILSRSNRLAELEAERMDLSRVSSGPTQIVVSAPTSNSNVQHSQTNILSMPSPLNNYAPQ